MRFGIRLIPVFVFFLCASVANAQPADPVWVGRMDGAFQVDAASGEILASIPMAMPVDALQVEQASGRVWLLSNNVLYRHAPDGTRELERSLPVDGGMVAQLLVLDDARNTLWVADPQNVFRFDMSGELVNSWSVAPGHFIFGMALDASGVLWLGGDDKVWRLSNDITLAFSSADLAVRGLDVDPARGELWLAGGHGLQRYTMNGLLVADIALPADFNAMRVVADGNGAWIAGPFAAARVTADDLAVSIAPFADVTSPWGYPANITDVADTLPPGHVWMSAADHVRLFAPDGTVSLDLVIPGAETITRVAPFRDSVLPEIRFDFPPDAAAFNDPRPVIGVSYSDEGSGIDAATLSFTVDAAATDFVCDAGEGFANCQPQQDLTEGAHFVTARITDNAGNISASAELNLAIDLTPPAAPAVSAIVVHFENGNAILTAPAASVEPGAIVTIMNTRTGESVTVTAGLDGSFSAQLPGAEGDTFTITVRDAAGNVSAPVERETGVRLPPDPATIAPPLARTAITPFAESIEFLYAGSNPVQFDVDPESIDEQRVVVLRGRVIDRDGEPLSGVRVSIHKNDASGYTLSRADGWYDFATNGGGHVTLNFEKDGFLSAQRQEKTPWRDYVVLDDVALIPLDSEVTTITLSELTGIAVARGSVIEDEDGVRQATLFVPHGTAATMTLPDGSQQSLNTVSIRATEYTVGSNGPAAMPGDLPPTSAYTYAVELSVDEAMAAGATRVDFSQPLPFYVDNFLDFPVGEVVPLGWYDRERAAWVPADNGKIIAVIEVDASGLAILDVDGSGDPASAEQLAELGITHDERRNLANLYAPGKSLWRVRIDHFTPWDCNWPFGPPEDAEKPPAEEPERPDEDQPDTKEDECESGCIIEMQRRNLGETVSLVGTPYSLNYRSNRMPGYLADNAIEIVLSEDTVPTSLRSIELVVEIAGRKVHSLFPPAPDQRTRFIWDGKDVYGRYVQGTVKAHTTVNFIYSLQYYAASSDFAQSFARFGTGESGSFRVIADRNSMRVQLARQFETPLSNGVPVDAGIGGWSLSVQHAYDVTAGILHAGDGRSIGAGVSQNRIIETVAGNGDRGWPGDGGNALNATFWGPTQIAFGPDGALYIADNAHRLVRRVGINGIVTTVAGNGERGAGPDGIPATDSAIGYVKSVDIGPDGTLYLTDAQNHIIRRVGADGLINTIAGNHSSGFSGDGGPATQAQLNYPDHFIFGADGALYISDSGNDRIRRVGADGIITTVAGNGERGFSGDGGVATDARLFAPGHLATDASGNLYVADRGNARIRRVGRDGVITTVAGNGQYEFSGEGVPATMASFYANGVAVGANGVLYIVGNGRIRRVGLDGIITTIAGKNTLGFEGDGGPAASAKLRDPMGIKFGPYGALYVADKSNNRIRRLRDVFGSTLYGTSHVASSDGSEIYVFDSSSRHLRTIDALTNIDLFVFEYDENNHLRRVVDVDGQATTIERDLNGRPTAIVAPEGQRTELTIGDDGYLAAVSHPDNTSHHMAYAEDGLLVEITDQGARTNTFKYGDAGFLEEDTDAAGGGLQLQSVEAESGYSVTSTSAEGRITTYSTERFASEQRQLKSAPDGSVYEAIFKPDGASIQRHDDGTSIVSTRVPDPRFGMQAPITSSMTINLPSGLSSQVFHNRATSLTDAHDPMSLETQVDTYILNGKSRIVVYAAATRESIATSAEGRTSLVRINDKGKPVLVHNGNLAETAYTYTTEGRIETVTEGTGAAERTTAFTYYTSGPSSGWLHSVTDAENRTVGYEYDLVGRVIKQLLPDLREVNYGYDAKGNLTSVTPPGRSAHNFTFTPVDLEDDYAPPDVLPGIDATDYAYNLDKQLELVTRPNGQTIDFVYGDVTGKLDQIVVPNGTYTFDYKPSSGQLETLTAPDGGQLGYTYDGFLMTGIDWSGSINGSIAYGYNTDFRMSTLAVNGQAMSFGYDDDGLLISAGALVLSRDVANGLLDTTTLGVVTTDDDVNTFGELDIFAASVSGNDIYTVDVERDKLGRITRKIETIEGVATTHEYGYDLAGRLDVVKRDGVVVADYGYDANGNRAHVNGVEVGIYDGQDRQLSYGDDEYVYTANGELRERRHSRGDGNPVEVTTYEYDVLGNLHHVVIPATDSVSDPTTIDYVIDGQNRRIGKKVNGTLVQGFLYQSQLEPVAELDGNNNVIARFVYAEKPHVPSYMVKGGNTYRIISDHLGSPRLVVDTATGEIVQRMDYDAWGNVTLDTNPGFQPFGFAGGIYDRDTELTRFGARDYDPKTGRWTAKDPIGLSGGINVYAYAENDPINLLDPTGLWSWGDPVPQGVVDAATGFGDGAFSVITFGLGDLGDIRDAMGIDGGVNECSAAYGAGSLAGNIVGGGTAGGLALRGAAAFGGTRLGNGLINSNRYLRVGPGRMPANGNLPAGPAVPRMSIGKGPNNPHVDLRVRPFD